MREYAIPLAHDALKTLSAKYQITPKGPILIEVFPNHDDFAVRTLGLPGHDRRARRLLRPGRDDGLAARRGEPGTFSWQATLWHELAHVITLQLSNQRVPRWLTEGISVYEEGKARQEWGREMEVPFAMALQRKETLKLKDLNAGFTRPETIALAYYQASLLVDHIVTTYGQDALRRLLVAYGEGLEGEAALAKGLGASTDKLQASFDAAVDKRFASLLSALRTPSNDGPSPPRAAREEPRGSESGGDCRSGQLRGAAGARSRPCRSRGCRRVRAARTRRGAGAGRHRRRQSQRGDGPARREARRSAARACGRIARCSTTITRRSSRRAAWRCSPRRPATRRRCSWRGTASSRSIRSTRRRTAGSGRLALKRRDSAVAMREFKAALLTNVADKATAHCDLGEAYLLAGRPQDAKKEALSALEIAPTFERAQDLLLRAVEGK